MIRKFPKFDGSTTELTAAIMRMIVEESRNQSVTVAPPLMMIEASNGRAFTLSKDSLGVRDQSTSRSTSTSEELVLVKLTGVVYVSWRDELGIDLDGDSVRYSFVEQELGSNGTYIDKKNGITGDGVDRNPVFHLRKAAIGIGGSAFEDETPIKIPTYCQIRKGVKHNKGVTGGIVQDWIVDRCCRFPDAVEETGIFDQVQIRQCQPFSDWFKSETLRLSIISNCNCLGMGNPDGSTGLAWNFAFDEENEIIPGEATLTRTIGSEPYGWALWMIGVTIHAQNPLGTLLGNCIIDPQMIVVPPEKEVTEELQQKINDCVNGVLTSGGRATTTITLTENGLNWDVTWDNTDYEIFLTFFINNLFGYIELFPQEGSNPATWTGILNPPDGNQMAEPPETPTSNCILIFEFKDCGNGVLSQTITETGTGVGDNMVLAFGELLPAIWIGTIDLVDPLDEECCPPSSAFNKKIQLVVYHPEYHTGISPYSEDPPE